MHKVISLILEAKKRRIKVLQKNQEAIISLAKKAPQSLGFKESIHRENKLSLIGEIKQASPSTGILKHDFSVLDIALTYKKLKVNALSVLTEEDFFLGKINYIEDIKKKVSLPILRKDFILEDIQVYESKAVGADAILLIMSILNEAAFIRLYDLAKNLGLDVLVEVSNEKDLKKALNHGVDILGINNRNLHTFEVDISKTQKLAPFIPSRIVKVSESGIKTLRDALLLKGAGVDAILVGTAFMQAENLEEKVKELHIDA